jgi:hypothetical protein
MSFLAGGEPEPEAPPAQNYGKLKPNAKARGRRGGVKFFDSADWAMKNGDKQLGTDEQPAVPYAQIAEGEQPADGESPLAASNSPLAG